MCYVYVFSFRRGSPDTILGDKPLIFDVVLSHCLGAAPLTVVGVGARSTTERVVATLQ
jgi:hypothetical protein